MLYLNNSTENAPNNAPNADALFSQARKNYDFVRQNAPFHIGTAAIDMQWTTFGSRRYGKDADGLMALARECRDYFADQRKVTETRLEAERERWTAHGAANNSAAVNMRDRTAFANANLQPLWNVGAKLVTIAGKVEATRPTPMVMQLPATATAPCGTDAELATHLDSLDADLAAVAKSLKDIRVGIRARAKAAA